MHALLAPRTALVLLLALAVPWGERPAGSARWPAGVAAGPAAFVPDLGQWGSRARFVHRSGAMTVLLEDFGWTLDLREPDRGVAVRMSFEGAAPAAAPRGETELPGVHHYFVGADPDRWRAGVPRYASVLYEGLYPGIDLRVRRAAGHPEYDLLLAPGAELGRVGVRVEGASGLRLGAAGALVLDTALGPVTQPVPVTWQTGPLGERLPLGCRYVLRGADRFGFEVEGWDGGSPLTIDPGLLWSTFVGAGNDEQAEAVEVDAQGVVTVAGWTRSAAFPSTPGAYDVTWNGDRDVFVSRFDPSATGGAQLLWSTFLGGVGEDVANDLSVGAGGVVAVAGYTQSPSFPTTPGAFDVTLGGSRDAFVAQLDPGRVGAAQLVYSTLLGGSGAEHAYGVAVGAGGALTVAGVTPSGDFPTTPGAFDRTLGGSTDLFLVRLDPGLVGGAQLAYSTFFGGTGGETAHEFSVDAAGVAMLVGVTGSQDFPTTPGAFDTTLDTGGDAFVSRLDPSLAGSAQLVYSTLLGGSQNDNARLASVDASGVVTVVGETQSADFPTTPGAYDRTHAGDEDAFVVRLDPGRSGAAQLLYSTFVGGALGEHGHVLSVDRAGVVTFAGETRSSDFPTTPGAFDRSLGGSADGYVVRLDPGRAGQAQLLYSTLLGGDGDDEADGLALDASGFAVVVGETRSANFPTTAGAHDPTYNGLTDAYVSRLDLLPAGVAAFGASSPGCDGPLPTSVTSWPQVGNTAFSITCSNAPPNGSGALVLSAARRSTPLVVLGVELWVDLTPPVVLLSVASNAAGAAEVALPIPAVPGVAGSTIFAQHLWVGPSAPPPCPPFGLSASGALSVTFQP